MYKEINAIRLVQSKANKDLRKHKMFKPGIKPEKP
jgi:hypothetical protein